MSNAGMPPTDPSAAMSGVWSSARTVLIVLGTALAGHGMATSGLYFWVQFAAGTIMVIGPAGFSLYLAIAHVMALRKMKAVGVASGLNLAASGKMLVQSDGSPVPVTLASAAEIVKNFAPITPAKAA